jgi:GNAT superfamily N-acetyltransferase
MIDDILLKKIKIWINLPLKYRLQEKELVSNYGYITVIWENNIMVIKSVYIYKEYRGQKIWTNLVDELEKLNIIIKLQSILNQRLLKFMIKCGWEKAINELSVYFIKTVENG